MGEAGTAGGWKTDARLRARLRLPKPGFRACVQEREEWGERESFSPCPAHIRPA